MTSYDSLPSMTSSTTSWSEFTPKTPEDRKTMVQPRIYNSGAENITLHIPTQDENKTQVCKECATVTEEDEETASEPHEPVTPSSIESHSPIFTLEQADHALRLAQTASVPKQVIQAPTPEASSTPAPDGRQSPPKSLISSSTTPIPSPGPALLKRSNTFSKLFHRSSSALHIPKLGHHHDDTPLSPRSQAQHNLPTGSHTTDNSPASSQANTPPKRLSPTNSFAESSGNRSPPKHSLLAANLGRLTRSRRSTSMNGVSTILAPNAVSIPAAEGVGLKSRRLSTAVLDMPLQVTSLSSKYCSKSHVPLKSKQIGEGATAVVKLMMKVKGDPSECFAVKEFRKKSTAESEKEYNAKLNSEYCLSKSLHHPNIVNTEDLCLSNSNRWCHVMEYCSGGDLYSLIQKGFMGAEEKMCCFKQLLRGVQYLHGHGIAHRDIKPENLLISADGHLKITDFGISEVFTGKHPGVCGMECGVGMDSKIKLCSPGISGSKPYLSPEVLEKKDEYDPRKLDVWSCAIVYITLHYGGFPWQEACSGDRMYSNYATAWKSWLNNNPDGEITSTSTVPGARVFQDMKPPLRRLLYKMAHPLPEKRIFIDEAVNDRWISSSVECCVSDEECDHTTDGSEKKTDKKAKRRTIIKLHNHLPPPQKMKNVLHHEA